MTEPSGLLFSREPSARVSSAGDSPRIEPVAVTLLKTAFLPVRRRYVSRALYWRLSLILWGAIAVVLVGILIANHAAPGTFLDDQGHFTGRGLLINWCVAGFVLLLVLRQLAITAARYRAAGASFWMAVLHQHFVWFLFGLPALFLTLWALTFADSPEVAAERLRMAEDAAKRGRPTNRLGV